MEPALQVQKDLIMLIDNAVRYTKPGLYPKEFE